jgi:hypothetical protein
MPTSRSAAVWTLFGLAAVVSALAVIVDRYRRPNRLFLYSYQGWPDRPPGASVAAVASIGPGFFQIENTFNFGDWTTVANARNGRNDWLFFHNRYNGAAETGYVDHGFRYHTKTTYPPGTFSDWPFQFAVVNGLGQLLLLGYKGSGAVVGLAEVLDDGTFVEWWRTEVDIPLPDFDVSSLVGLPNAHAWFSSSPAQHQRPAGGSVVVFDVKHARVVSTRRSEVVWDSIAVDGDLLYLFNAFEGLSEICSVDEDGELATVKAAAQDADVTRNLDQYVASTRGAHLGYSYPRRTAHVRVLSRSGFPSTYEVNDSDKLWMEKVWVNIVPC